MAPGLRGIHKQLVCPECSTDFGFGVLFDESVGPSKQGEIKGRFATCPNCGLANIAVDDVPSAHGDQLLVHKGIFDFRSPRRWETVVFLNPAKPGEAYVKRAVASSGEVIRVIDGDLFIDGEIATKDFETQKEMRIPVFNLQRRATSSDWQLPWAKGANWVEEHGRLIHSTEDSTNETDDWVTLRGWRWTGGTHTWEVPVPGDHEADWQVCLEELNRSPVSWMTRLGYDREREVLRLRGVMPYEMQARMTSWPTTEAFRKAIFRLGALSHISPITDRYGYNSLVASPESPVRDLFLSVRISWAAAPAKISARIPSDSESYRVDLWLEQGVCNLVDESNEKILASAERRFSNDSELLLEVSNFDRRIIVAIDDEEIFPMIAQRFSADEALKRFDAKMNVSDVPEIRSAKETSLSVTRQSRLGFAVLDGQASVRELRLYRDVHYTPGRRKNAVEDDFTVPDGCYFVLGDNSPVSSDSRSWPDAVVPHRLLIGKPFVVHLPSKPGKLTIGGIETPIRIPDTGRIRYIR